MENLSSIKDLETIFVNEELHIILAKDFVVTLALGFK
jgi:hypothetical protein